MNSIMKNKRFQPCFVTDSTVFRLARLLNANRLEIEIRCASLVCVVLLSVYKLLLCDNSVEIMPYIIFLFA